MDGCCIYQCMWMVQSFVVSVGVGVVSMCSPFWTRTREGLRECNKKPIAIESEDTHTHSRQRPPIALQVVLLVVRVCRVSSKRAVGRASALLMIIIYMHVSL